MAFIVLSAIAIQVKAEDKRPVITVLNIDTKGIQLDPTQVGNLVRIELEKLDTFDVTDRYDVAYLIEKHKLNINNCYGKGCLLEIGKLIQSDYMYTGNVELYGQTIIVTLRLINVQTESVDRSIVMEFLNLPLEVQSMIGLSIQKMFGRSVNEDLQARLTTKFDYDNSINNPDKERLNLQGPRFGYAFMVGAQATKMKQSYEEGGYDAYPAMFQFGYQFEKQYLNEGNYQALFEFIPMISGLDQQMIIPSLTILNGFRNNKKGWEVAIGPSFSVTKYAQLAMVNGTYYTEEELQEMGITDYSLEKHMDSRGDPGIGTTLVFGVGKTFKSGKMNIPVNVWSTFPSRDGFRFGISVGYNSKK